MIHIYIHNNFAEILSSFAKMQGSNFGEFSAVRELSPNRTGTLDQIQGFCAEIQGSCAEIQVSFAEIQCSNL